MANVRTDQSISGSNLNDIYDTKKMNVYVAMNCM